MKDIRAVFSALRKNGKGQYKLLSGCLFFGSLLITAFCMMMYSPTVQNTLPQGGDSRKQVMMIFILAVICDYIFYLFFSFADYSGCIKQHIFIIFPVNHFPIILI